MMLRLEIKKAIKKRMNMFIITGVFVLAVVFSLMAMRSFRYIDPEGETHTGLMSARSLVSDKNKWTGALTSDVISKIVETERNARSAYGDFVPDEVYGKELQSFQDILFSLSSMYSYDDGENDLYAIISASPEDISRFYEIYGDNLKKASVSYGATDEKAAFIYEQYKKIEMPIGYKAADVWDTMQLYVTTFSIVLVIVTGFLSAGIFSEEYHHGAESVFFSSRHGRGKAIKTKIVASFLITTTVYWLAMALMCLICFAFMGAGGAFTPYQFYHPYSIYVCSCGTMLLIEILCGYVACLLSSSISMFVASKTKMMSIAVCFPFALFCVSPFIGRALPFKTFFTLTPDQLTNIMNCAKIPYIYQAGSLVFRQIPFIMGIYFLVSVFLLPLVYICYRGNRR